MIEVKLQVSEELVNAAHGTGGASFRTQLEAEFGRQAYLAAVKVIETAPAKPIVTAEAE